MHHSITQENENVLLYSTAINNDMVKTIPVSNAAVMLEDQ